MNISTQHWLIQPTRFANLRCSKNGQRYFSGFVRHHETILYSVRSLMFIEAIYSGTLNHHYIIAIKMSGPQLRNHRKQILNGARAILWIPFLISVSRPGGLEERSVGEEVKMSIIDLSLRVEIWLCYKTNCEAIITMSTALFNFKESQPSREHDIDVCKRFYCNSFLNFSSFVRHKAAKMTVHLERIKV